MKEMKVIIAVFMIVFLSGCASQKEMISETEQLSFKVLKNGALFGGGEEGIEEGVYLITNIEEWNKQVARLNTINQHVQPNLANEVDFEQDMLLMLVDHLRGTGGNSYRTTAITRTNKALQITIERKAPEGPATSVMTQPYEIIQIRKQDLAIELLFIE